MFANHLHVSTYSCSVSLVSSDVLYDVVLRLIRLVPKKSQAHHQTKSGLVSRVGMDLATVQVRVENLKVEADIAVGSRGNPTVANTLRNIVGVSSTTPFME